VLVAVMVVVVAVVVVASSVNCERSDDDVAKTTMIPSFQLAISRLTVVSRVAKKNAHATTTESLFTRTKMY